MILVKIVFTCGNDRCHAVADADKLNAVRLKIIRRVPLLCKRCNKRTMWVETSALVDDETNKITEIREPENAKVNAAAH